MTAARVRLFRWLVSLACFVTVSGNAAPGLYTDLRISNTIIVRDFNGVGIGPSVIYAGGAAPVESNAGGVSTFTYSAFAADPQIILNNPVGTYDFATYNWARLRYRSSSGPQIWENSAVGGQSFTGAVSATNFLEQRGDPTNPDPRGTGYRIDPVGNVADGANYTFELDYLMADRMQTIGLGEWDADGNLGGANGSNWAGTNITGLTVANGVISGTGTGDAILSHTMTFDAASWGMVEIRMKSSGNRAELFWGNNAMFSQTQKIDLTNQDGAYHVYTLDFSKEATWLGANMRIRLDPATVNGQTFEVDYVRIMQVPVAYWDADGNTSTGTGGSGTWSAATNTRNWRGEQGTTPGTGLLTYWVNSPYDDAVFAGTAGTVTVDGSVTVNDVSFQTSGYTLTAGTVNLAGQAPQITVTTGHADVQSTLTGTLGLSKLGEGALQVSGANTYSGGTTVSAGTLLANSASGSATGTGAVTVAAGATLGGNGGLTGSVTVNGRLSPGGDGTLPNFGIGVLKTGALTLAASSTGSAFELAANGYQDAAQTLLNGNTINTTYLANKSNRATGSNDRLEVQGTLNISDAGGMLVAFAAGYSPAYGHAYDLFDWTNLTATNFNYGSVGSLRTGGETENASYDLALPDLNTAVTGWYYNMDAFLSHGVIVVVPEPSRAVLMLLGVVGFLWRRRR